MENPQFFSFCNKRVFSPKPKRTSPLNFEGEGFSFDSIAERSPYVQRLCFGNNTVSSRRQLKLDPLSTKQGVFSNSNFKISDTKD